MKRARWATLMIVGALVAAACGGGDGAGASTPTDSARTAAPITSKEATAFPLQTKMCHYVGDLPALRHRMRLRVGDAEP